MNSIINSPVNNNTLGRRWVLVTDVEGGGGWGDI